MTTESHRTHDRRRSAAERRQRIAALVSAVGLAAIAVFAFVGTGWLSSSYKLRADFASSNGLVPGNPVRIAGVDVGTVSAITPGARNTSVVAMSISNSALPIHVDATAAIEPRLILEGSFYVVLEPGSPGTSLLPSGGEIPRDDTTDPVQIDQVLDTFDLATRDSLQRTVSSLADGLGAGNKASTGAPPDATGYGGLRGAARALDGALGSLTNVARDAQGTVPGDLDRAILGSRDVTTQLAQSPSALAGLVSNFNSVLGALSAEDEALGASTQGLDIVARAAPPAFSALDAALPKLTTFARALRPALDAAPGPLRAITGLAARVDALVQPSKLPALVDQLTPIVTTLPSLEHGLGQLLPLVTRANQCLSGHVVWALDQKVPDGALSTGDPAFLDALHLFTSITSFTGGFDGNGSAARAGVVENSIPATAIIPGLGSVVAHGGTLAGVRPTWLGYGVEPPYRPDQWCADQPLPDLAQRSGPPPEWDGTAASAQARGKG